jgi:glycerol-3-phosphate dehydrogenase
MVTVAGGKLTTYRRIAGNVLDALRPQLGLQRLDSRVTPLPGAADPEVVAAALCRDRPDFDPTVASLLARTYGSLATEVLALDPDPFAAQVRYAREHEWAVNGDDVLRRRTTVALRGLDTPEIRAQVDELMRE